MKTGPKPVAPEIRAQRFIEKRGPDECWPWTGSIGAGGYGQISAGPRGASPERAHRVAWQAENGPIPDGFGVLHSCDNPPCCNAKAHLFLGTQADNMADAARKKRLWSPKGNASPVAKLTDAQVVDIRERYKTAGVTQRSLADEFGVHPGTISSIVRLKHRV